MIHLNDNRAYLQHIFTKIFNFNQVSNLRHREISYNHCKCSANVWPLCEFTRTSDLIRLEDSGAQFISHWQD